MLLEDAKSITESVALMTARSDEMLGRNLQSINLDNIKRVVMHRQLRHLRRDALFWDNAALMLAIQRYSAQNSIEYPHAGALSRRRLKLKIVDHMLYCYANFTALSAEQRRSSFAFLKSQPRDSVGNILYRRSSTSAFVDTLGMVCPFLFLYGVIHNEEAAISLALEQLRLFFRYGIDIQSGLPFHGFDVAAGLKCGIIGWGRGVGWLMFALAEGLRCLPKESSAFSEILEMLVQLVDKVLLFQRHDGGFSWQLALAQGHFDTSATSMIGYSILSLVAYAGQTKYAPALNRILRAAHTHVDDRGQVHHSSAECGGFGVYPQYFGSNAWGQGFTNLLVVAVISMVYANRE